MLIRRAFIAVAIGSAILPEGQSLKSRFPPPAGFTQTDEREEPGKRDFPPNLKGLSGLAYEASFEFKTETGSPSALTVLRHYAELLKGQAGIRLDDGIAGASGRLTGRIGGSRPVWLRVAVANNGAQIDLLVFEESNPSRSEFAVEPERIPGAWNAPSKFSRAGEFPAGERAAVSAMLSRAAALLSSALTPAFGFQWEVSADFPSGSDPAARSTPYPSLVRFDYFNLYQDCPRCPIVRGGEPHPFASLHVNDVSSVLESDSTTGSNDGFYLAPALTPQSPQVSSFNDGRRVLVMRTGRPALWRPVTREAYLSAEIRWRQQAETDGTRNVDAATKTFEEQIKILERLDPAAARAARAEFAANRTAVGGMLGVKELQDELAGLSAEERRAPARHADGRAIVTPNPAYFDSALPPGSAQLLVLNLDWMTGDHEHTLLQADLVDRLLRDVTPAKLADLIR